MKNRFPTDATKYPSVLNISIELEEQGSVVSEIINYDF